MGSLDDTTARFTEPRYYGDPPASVSSLAHNALLGRDVAGAHTAAVISSAASGGLTATNVQAALEELQADKVETTDPRLSDPRPPTAHGHTVSELSDASSSGLDLLTAPDVPAQRTALGLGSMSTQWADAVAVTGGTITGTRVRDRGGAVINAKGEGILGDGTEESANIQAFISDLVSGQRPYFPEGRYRIGNTIDIGDGSTAGASSVNFLTFLGNGHGIDVGNLNPGYGAATVFEWGGAAGAPMFRVNGPITVNFRDMDFLGTSSGNSCGNAIELFYAMYSSLERISIRRHGGIGIRHTGYATRPTGASWNGANLMMKQVFCGFGSGTAWTGLELGDVGAGGDPCQTTAIGCTFNGGLNGDAVRLRYTDNNSFRQCTLTNYAGGAALRIKPVAGQALFPAENAFYNCPMVANSAALTVVIDESDQAWNPYLTTISFWPFPVGDAWGVPPLPTDVRLSGITDSAIMFGKTLTLNTHLDTAGLVPTAALGAGAGTGATVTLYQCTDTAGLIRVHTGTSPSANLNVVVLTYARAYTTRANALWSPSTGPAALLSGTSQVIVSSSTSQLTIQAGSVALAANTDYYWTYHVIGT